MTTQQYSIIEKLVDKVDTLHTTVTAHIASANERERILTESISNVITNIEAATNKVGSHETKIALIERSSRWLFAVSTIILLPFAIWIVKTVNNIPEMIQEALAVYKLPK